MEGLGLSGRPNAVLTGWGISVGQGCSASTIGLFLVWRKASNGYNGMVVFRDQLGPVTCLWLDRVAVAGRMSFLALQMSVLVSWNVDSSRWVHVGTTTACSVQCTEVTRAAGSVIFCVPAGCRAALLWLEVLPVSQPSRSGTSRTGGCFSCSRWDSIVFLVSGQHFWR